MATIRGNTQIIDHSINLVKLESDFLNGANWDITNGANNAVITGLAAPVNDHDAASKQYVDGLIQGIQGQFATRVKAQVNVAALTGTQTVDGVALVDGDMVLLGDQTTVSEDGLYIVRAGAWERSSGWEAGEGAGAFFVFVEEGTDDNKGFVCSNDKGADIIGTDDLNFIQFSGAGSIGAGAGLTQNGSDIDVVATDLSINVNANDVGVNIGTTNGTSLEVSATGLELAQTVTGTRSFTTGGTNFDVIAGAGNVVISGTDISVSGTSTVSLVGSAQTEVGLFLSGDTNINGFNLNFKDNEVETSANTTAIPLAITATTDYGNGNGTTAGDVIDQFRTEFTDDGILNAICQVKAELDTYSVTTANGISTVAGVVELGGSLTKTTTINANYHDLTYYGNRDLANFYEVVNFGTAAGGELSDFNIVLTQNFQADVSDFIVNGSNVSFGTTQNSYTIGQTPDGTVPLAIATTQYVDNQVTSGVTASNGLTKSGADVQLGGTLTTDTHIHADGHELYVGSGNNLVEIGGVTAGNVRASISTDTMNYGDGHVQLTTSDGTDWVRLVLEGSDIFNIRSNNANFGGAVYDSDYSANYSARSLVDRDYVLAQLAAVNTRKYNNTTTLNIGGQTATLTSAPATGFVNGVVYLNGLRQVLTTDYTITNATTGEITFTAAQPLTAGDSVIMDYSDQ